MQQIDHPDRAAVIYVRTASAAISGESHSLDRQRRICEAHARHHSLTVTKTYVDAGVSGLAEHRPGLDRLLTDIANERIGYVITADMTRLARSQTLARSLASRIARLGARLVNVK